MKYNPNRRTVVQGLGLGTLGMMTGSLQDITRATAQEANPKLEPLLQAAANEGPVIWYETTATELLQPCVAAFNKRYPKVVVEHVRAIGTGDMVAKVIQESRAPGKSADMVTTTADQTWGIASRDLALDVNWTDYGVPAKFVPEKFAVMCAHSLFCIVYNTQRLTEAEAPKGWEDLTNPAWKGKIGSPTFAHPYAGLVPVWGEDRTDKYLDQLMLNQPVTTASTYTLAQQVGSGELIAAVGLNWTARPIIQRGGPVKIVLPDPLPVSTNYNTIPKYAKNVNSAKLLACWLTTNEGARAYEAATGRGNLFLDTEAAKLKLPRLSEFPIREVPKLAQLIEKYNKVLRKGAPG